MVLILGSEKKLIDGELPNLSLSTSRIQESSSGQRTYQNSKIPDVNLVVPPSAQDDLRSAIRQCLDFAIIVLVVGESRAKIAQYSIAEIIMDHLAAGNNL